MSDVKRNPFLGCIVEFHILQSFPVSCLNRDDVGAPKSAIVGGVPRARVSSQCWKRQVRLALHQMGCKTANRTLLVYKMIQDACIELGANEEQATKCAKSVVDIVSKKLNDDGTASALVFLSDKEVEAIANAFKENDFNVLDKKSLISLLKDNLCTAYDGLDIALFGRMVAQTADLDVEAACGFSHAISTHKVVSEIDFFTALDDLKEDRGSGHMGSLEFNSATYYRYVSVNLGQLYQTLQGVDMDKAMEMFVKALYVAVPEARQHTQSAASFWDFARIYIRKGQRLQASFEKPVKSRDGGYLEASKLALCSFLDEKKKQAGSLFGLIDQMDFGEGSDLSIDDVVKKLADFIREQNA